MSLTLFALMAVGPVLSLAICETIEISKGDGSSVEAIVRRPTVRKGAVIYLHGHIVQEIGQEEAQKRGYDLKGYLDAFASHGFFVIAPLRKSAADAMPSVQAALKYIEKHLNYDQSQIAVVGFSAGGRLALELLLRHQFTGPVVAMSPAPLKLPGSTSGYEGRKLLVTAGLRDPNSIRMFVTSDLVPFADAASLRLVVRDQYPGDHRWFWKVRKGHFGQVVDFLSEAQKAPASR